MWRHTFRDRRKALISQRQLEGRLEWPVGTIGAVEDGRIRLADDQQAELDRLLDIIEKEKACNKREVTTVA